MTDPAGREEFGEQHNRLDGLDQEAEFEAKRKHLVELEYTLQAIQMHMGSVVRELESLEGVTLTSLMSRVKGDREARLEQARERWSVVEKKLADTNEAVEILRREVEETEARRSAEAPANPPREKGLPGMQEENPIQGAASPVVSDPREQHGTEEQAKRIRRVIELCEECRKGLLAEIEAAGQLGRCKVVATKGFLGGLLGATTNRARNNLAAGVRSDLRRLSGRFNEVVAAGSVLAEESEARARLAHFAERFEGAWLTKDAPAGEAANDVVQTLCLVEMLLEKRLNDVTRG